MRELRFGPVEMYLIAFEGERPDPGTFAALGELIEAGTVRLLDVVLLAKSADGAVEIIELDGIGGEWGLGEEVPLVAGLAGEEDVEALTAELEPGRSAALVVLELAYARVLAQRLADAGGRVTRSERIPAPVVNAMIDILEQEGE